MFCLACCKAVKLADQTKHSTCLQYNCVCKKTSKKAVSNYKIFSNR